jgi:hypothetical protein
MRKKTVAVAAVMTIIAATVAVPASASQRPEPTVLSPAAVKECNLTPPTATAQIRSVCFTKTAPPGVTPKKQAKPRGVGTNVDCGNETWSFTRVNTCMREHGYLEHFTLVCQGSVCRRVTTGWVEVNVTYHSTTFVFNQEWIFRTEVEAVAAEGTGHEGVIMSAEFGCEGACFASSEYFPSQHLTVGGTAGGEGWFMTNINGPNQRRYGRGNILMTFTRPGSAYPGQHLQTVGTETRCDSTLNSTGCVFWIFTPIFALDFDWHNEAAEHVAWAQRSGLVGKDWPLTRTTDPAKIQSNRETACPAHIPRPPGRSCDEYPFASTNEGAARYGPDDGRTFFDCSRPDLPEAVTGAGGWSACMINEVDNSTAGADLGVFYEDNRVIDGDEFFVEVD